MLFIVALLGSGANALTCPTARPFALQLHNRRRCSAIVLAEPKKVVSKAPTPAQVFEKAFAPIFTPPSRPDLKAKYQKPSGAAAAPPKADPEPEPVAAKADSGFGVPAPGSYEERMEKLRLKKLAQKAEEEAYWAAQGFAAEAPPAPASAPKKVASKAVLATKSAPKPAAPSPSTSVAGSSPAEAFEKAFAPIFVPPSRPDLKAKYQKPSGAAAAPPKARKAPTPTAPSPQPSPKPFSFSFGAKPPSSPPPSPPAANPFSFSFGSKPAPPPPPEAKPFSFSFGAKPSKKVAVKRAKQAPVYGLKKTAKKGAAKGTKKSR